MSAPPPAARSTATKAQVQAYRFGMRRLENAVATGQSYRRTLGGPRHGLSFIISLVLATLVLAGFAVFGLISPAPSIGDAKVVVDSDHGGAYVVRNHRLYPALNLASAMLAAGASGSNGNSGTPSVKVVDASTLADMPKGQTLGINGAPNLVPSASSLVSGTWTVCDTSTISLAVAPSSPPTITTTAVLGRRLQLPAPSVRSTALVHAVGDDNTVYLLWSGGRSKVITTDSAVRLALGTDQTTPRPVSPGLLAAIPAGPDIKAPPVADRGAAVDWNPNLRVGDVFQVQLAAGVQNYLALADSYEEITPLLSDLIRAEYLTTTSIPRIAPSALKRTHATQPVPRADYPSQRPLYASVGQASTLCVAWNGQSGSSGQYTFYAAGGVPLPEKDAGVPALPQSPAGTANFTYLAPGHGAVYGQVVGDQTPSSGALFLVTDQGVKYPVVSAAALTYLGLGKAKIQAAPPTLLNLLPTGPTLDPAAATMYYDSQSGH